MQSLRQSNTLINRYRLTQRRTGTAPFSTLSVSRKTQLKLEKTLTSTHHCRQDLHTLKALSIVAREHYEVPIKNEHPCRRKKLDHNESIKLSLLAKNQYIPWRIFFYKFNSTCTYLKGHFNGKSNARRHQNTIEFYRNWGMIGSPCDSFI